MLRSLNQVRCVPSQLLQHLANPALVLEFLTANMTVGMTAAAAVLKTSHFLAAKTISPLLQCGNHQNRHSAPTTAVGARVIDKNIKRMSVYISYINSF